MAVCPADHLLRRTRLGLFRPDLLSTTLSKSGLSDRCERKS
jgi:hypothetical protein